MSRFNTGNPIGSADPRDRDDNSKNLDEAVNDLNSDTWVDRFGVERITIHGALNRFNEIIISGGQIFESEEAGRGAVQDGQYYYTPGDDPDISKILWRRISETESERVADDPSLEFVATLPWQISDYHRANSSTVFDFYTLDENELVYAVISPDGLVSEGATRDGTKHEYALLDFFESSFEPTAYWVTPEMRVIISIGRDGGASGGSDLSRLPATDYGLPPGAGYTDYSSVYVAKSGNSFINADPSVLYPTIDDFLVVFDDLVNEFPDYIERFTFGVDDFGNDLVGYRARPDGYFATTYPESDPELIKRPRIVLIGCTHGDEKSGTFSNYQLLREICLRWKEDERLSLLRWGLDLTVIPALNPSGFNADTRVNGNDVDINRNFPYQWSPDSFWPPGPEPLSEAESRAFLDFVRAEENQDVYCYIDHHNSGGLTGSGYAYWVGTEREETIEIARKSCDHMTAYVRREFSYVDQSNGPITQITASRSATLSKQLQRAEGKRVLLLETGAGFQTRLDRERHAFEAVLNLVTSVVENAHLTRQLTTQIDYSNWENDV